MTNIVASVAPMEGITTFPTRLWLHLASQPAAMTTPFLRVTQVFPETQLPHTFVPELFELRGILPYAVTPQYMACESEHFLRAVRLLPPQMLDNHQLAFIELNCGCPTPNGAGKNAGSGILRDPSTFGAMIDRLCHVLGPGKLAVKMRLGIESRDEFQALIAQIASLPLARLTVHGRTRVQKYQGDADWSAIESAATQTNVPVWASGDVVGKASYDRLQQIAPSIQGVMIGRGLLRNPWVFSELRSGEPVMISAQCLAQALVCYGMLHELWIKAPDKVSARVMSGRFNEICGIDAEAWQRLSAQLSAMLGSAPFALFDAHQIPSIPVSANAFARVKLLWGYLRFSLPGPYQQARLMRVKNLQELIAGILAVKNGGVFPILPTA